MGKVWPDFSVQVSNTGITIGEINPSPGKIQRIERLFEQKLIIEIVLKEANSAIFIHIIED